MPVCCCLRSPPSMDGTAKLSSTRLVLRLDSRREPGEVSRHGSRNLRLRSLASKSLVFSLFRSVRQAQACKSWHKSPAPRVLNRTSTSYVFIFNQITKGNDDQTPD